MNDPDTIDPSPSAPFWVQHLDSTDSIPCDLDETCDAFGQNTGIRRILVLNLDRQTKRWGQFQREAKSQIVRGGGSLIDLCERVKAVDGLATPVGSFHRHELEGTYSLEDFYFVDPQPILSKIVNKAGIMIQASPQEMAIAQSHLEVWKRIANEGATTLILEDDAHFLGDFTSRLNRVWAELPEVESREKGFDLLYISYRVVDSGIRKIGFSKSLIRPIGGLWWLSGYVMTSEGAAKLLDTLPIRGPVDQWVNHQFANLRVYASSIPLISQRRAWASDNCYSIVPVLRSVKGAVVSAGEPQPGMLESKRSPVFAIGLNKTGTTSLHEALSLLGYRSCHWQSDDFSEETNALITAGKPLPFEAYTDVASIVERYEELDRQYPSAAFILTLRDLEDWLASRAHHVALNRVENAINGQPRYSWTDIDPVAWRNERIRHHEAVFRYFKNRPEKLLVMDICGGDRWTDLCAFLNCPQPNVPFPHVNPLAIRSAAADLSLGPLKIRKCSSRPLKHDDYPWIRKPSKTPATSYEDTVRAARGGRIGSFSALFRDSVEHFDNERWIKLDDTFDTNLAVFRPENVSVLRGGGLRFSVMVQQCQDRSYTAGAISLRGGISSHFTYGRFEAEIKPARADGILTGMFLHRRDPWQEIDLEFLGAKPDRMLINVYYNPGEEGDLYNYGVRGTPVLIDLGFDASRAFHHYAIEWDPTGVRWFVDGELVFARGETPTPVPHLPMRFYLNTFPVNAEELAGNLSPTQLPATTDIKSVAVSSWIPSVHSVVSSRGQGLTWIQKGRKL